MSTTFLSKLVSPELLTEITAAGEDAAKVDAVIAKFQNSFSEKIKGEHATKWETEHAEKIRKDASVGAYKTSVKELVKEFGLPAEKAKEILAMEKDEQKAAIREIKAAHEALLKQYEAGKDGTVTQLTSQLEAANKLAKEYEEKVNNFPNQLKQMELDWKGNQVFSKAVTGIIAKYPKNAALTPQQLEAVEILAKAKADFKYSLDANGNLVTSIINKATQTPFAKSVSENYKDIEDFVVAEVLKKSGFWAEQGGGGKGTGGGNGNPNPNPQAELGNNTATTTQAAQDRYR